MTLNIRGVCPWSTEMRKEGVKKGLCKKVLLTAIEKFHLLQNCKACINLLTLKKAWPISTTIVQGGWLEALTSIWKQKKSLKLNWRMDGPVALIMAYFDLKKKSFKTMTRFLDAPELMSEQLSLCPSAIYRISTSCLKPRGSKKLCHGKCKNCPKRSRFNW